MKKGLLTGILAFAVFATAGAAQAAKVQVLVRGEAPRMGNEDAGAHGLLAAGAGPTVSRDSARAALVRGRVQNSLVGGPPEGEPLIELGERPGADVTILVELPPPGGEYANRQRYAISIVGGGYEGILESSSTRIPGLVSIADVAPTVLALERGEEPPITADSGSDVSLPELDELIRAKNDVRAPAMFLAAGVVALLALFRPRAAVVAVSALLLANLALGAFAAEEAWLVLLALATSAALAVPWARSVEVGALFAATVFVYLLALGVNGAAVALSPLGPTQNARFYGLSNVLATFLLVTAVAGAGVAGRRYGPAVFVLVAVAAFVATAGNTFGADGGGAVVLLAAFAVLTTMVYGPRAGVTGVAALAVLFAFDLAFGESHITRALDDGVWDDLTRRAGLSWERATKTWYDAVYLGALLAALAGLVARYARRDPILVALAVGLGVSLVVNDSPNEVLVPGVACYLAVSTWLDRVARHEA